MIPTQQAATTPFQSASLYVGDLHNEVTEVSFLKTMNSFSELLYFCLFRVFCSSSSTVLAPWLLFVSAETL